MEFSVKDSLLMQADRVQVVPSEGNPRLLCLAEPLALALHIVARAGDVNGRWCLVAGVGNVGRMATSILSALKAKIIAWDISQEKLHEARLIGAQVLINASEPEAESKVHDITGNEGVSVAFETAGQSKTLESCIKLAAFGGRVVVGHSKQISNIYGSDIF
jgi:threonine dehydrogenase-like Zn-dependent dehydrogenase